MQFIQFFSFSSVIQNQWEARLHLAKYLIHPKIKTNSQQYITLLQHDPAVQLTGPRLLSLISILNKWMIYFKPERKCLTHWIKTSKVYDYTESSFTAGDFQTTPFCHIDHRDKVALARTLS